MKTRSFIVVFLTLASAGFSEQSAINVADLGDGGRIVGGMDIRIEEAPYQASLQYFGSHICGAGIISKNYIITAAHCV